MAKPEVVKCIRTKYLAIISDLDERGRRRWAAAEARSLGWGGISAVTIATGISDRTIRNGLKELGKSKQLSPNRQRQLGGGRHSREDEQPGLLLALNSIIEATTRGDPVSPLLWTCKSTRLGIEVWYL